MAELKVEHVSPRPPQEVFAAWTTPELFTTWFGPQGWHVPLETISIDTRVGEVNSFVLVQKDNPTITSQVSSTLDAIEEGRLLEWSEESPFETGPVHLRVELAEHGDNETKMTITQQPLPEEYVENSTQGWEYSLAKLDGMLLGKVLSNPIETKKAEDERNNQ
ncbi:SRPBCC family protein [Micrococcoides hystricis]|uniref:SRPBCC domain-containing protein n=1 Tax=Micrococcoides hystricis TaxID=1572761 RepID=A0ABV6PCM2_9MICC